MPKSLDDVKSALTKLDDGVELYDVVSDAILQERNKGKGLVRDSQRKIDSMTAAFKGVGFDPTTTDADSFVRELKEKVEAGEQSSRKLTEDQKTMQKLQKSVGTLQEQLNESKQIAERESKAKKDLIVREAVIKGLKGKLYGAEAHTVRILAEELAGVNGDGKSVVSKDGEDFQTFIDGYIKAHPDDVINAQSSGAGGNASSGSLQDKVIVRSAFDKMTQEERTAHFKDGGTVRD